MFSILAMMPEGDSIIGERTYTSKRDALESLRPIAWAWRPLFPGIRFDIVPVPSRNGHADR